MSTATRTRTRASATQRMSDFQQRVNERQKAIRAAGNEAWARVTAKSEVGAVREFLAGKNCGTDYLNAALATLLNRHMGTRVVKFASVFLHQSPMVRGWHQPRTGGRAARVHLPRNCELGDLQTLFLYLDRAKNVRQMRSVVFQAKLTPKTKGHVIDHEEQRQLYDHCHGFTYMTPATLKGQDRTLPRGADRVRALQYLFVAERPVLTRTLPAEVGQGSFQTFGEHLLRFMNDSTGLAVHDRAATDPWSRVVKDMLDHVADKIIGGSQGKTKAKTTAAAKGKGKDKGLRRNRGLDAEFRAVLDEFNSFESHQVYHLSAEGDLRKTDATEAGGGEGGFGAQLVIVWDPELGLDDDEGTAADERGIPKEPTPGTKPMSPLRPLLALAQAYEEADMSDEPMHISVRALLVENMCDIILTTGLDLHEVAAQAVPPLHNALAAALAAVYQTSRWKEAPGILYGLLPLLDHEHVAVAVLDAIIWGISNGLKAFPSSLDELDLVRMNFPSSFRVSSRVKWIKSMMGHSTVSTPRRRREFFIGREEPLIRVREEGDESVEAGHGGSGGAGEKPHKPWGLGISGREEERGMTAGE